MAQRSRMQNDRGKRRCGAASVVAVLLLSAAACTGEEAVPVDPANPPVLDGGAELDLTDVTHSLEPTEQMRDLAEQQCVDDPELAEGFIEAVDPETGQQISAITVDCDDVR